MTGGGPDPRRPSAAAAEAAPVRRWLIQYFRRRIQNDADAEDLAQEVFARMAARDAGEPIESLGGYMVKVAANVLTDWSRRRAARGHGHHLEFNADIHGGDEIDPARVLEGKEDLRTATRALIGLPERTRSIFILRRLEGWSYKDIAAHVGISVSAVEKHMVRAVQCISVEMEERHDP